MAKKVVSRRAISKRHHEDVKTVAKRRAHARRQRDRYRRRREEGLCTRCGGEDGLTSASNPGSRDRGAYCLGCRDEVQVYDDVYDGRRSWKAARSTLRTARMARASRRSAGPGA